MPKLENTEVSKLVELQNVLEKSNTSLETCLNAVDKSEENLRYDLIDYIIENLTKANYEYKTITITFISLPKDYHYHYLNHLKDILTVQNIMKMKQITIYSKFNHSYLITTKQFLINPNVSDTLMN